MSTSVFALIGRLRTANRLLLVLLVAGAGMLAYDASLGLRYWNGVSRGTTAQTEARALLASARPPSGVMADLEAQLTPSEALIESRGAGFSYEHTDELIGLVATIARESGVALASINVSQAGRRTAGPLTFGLIALTIRVSGSTPSLYGFIEALSEAAPGMQVRGARLGNLSGAPWASFEIDIPLNPAPTHGGEQGA